MSNKTIAKFSAFVIFLGSTGSLFFSCSLVSSDETPGKASSGFSSPAVIGTIRSAAITESSGIAASKCQKGVLWTHNDSGDDAIIYALALDGSSIGTWKVPNAENIDWEDIAAYKDPAGKCFLYIGEIGDNRAKRPEHTIYRIVEPTVVPAAAASGRQNPLLTDRAEVLRFSYPDLNQDAETLMVLPKNGDIYVVTKRISGPAGVYLVKGDFGGDAAKARKVADIAVPAIPNGFLTGGDISPDSRHVIICDYTRAYEWTLPDDAATFDEIWRQKPEPVELGPRAVGEAVGYSMDGRSIFATSEHANSPLIEVKRR